MHTLQTLHLGRLLQFAPFVRHAVVLICFVSTIFKLVVQSWRIHCTSHCISIAPKSYCILSASMPFEGDFQWPHFVHGLAEHFWKYHEHRRTQSVLEHSKRIVISQSYKMWNQDFPDLYTLPETKKSHLKMDGWNTSFLLGWPIFRCHVSFRECNSYTCGKHKRISDFLEKIAPSHPNLGPKPARCYWDGRIKLNECQSPPVAIQKGRLLGMFGFQPPAKWWH